jgi:hypothetical protein
MVNTTTQLQKAGFNQVNWNSYKLQWEANTSYFIW